MMEKVERLSIVGNQQNANPIMTPTDANNNNHNEYNRNGGRDVSATVVCAGDVGGGDDDDVVILDVDGEEIEKIETKLNPQSAMITSTTIITPTSDGASPQLSMASRQAIVSNKRLASPVSGIATPNKRVRFETNEQESDQDKQIGLIFDTLRKSECMGEFSVEGEAFEMPTMLGLEVDTFGPVCFPLVDPQARNLIASACQQSLFDKNGLPFAKAEMPCFNYIDAAKVKINNPVWKGRLNELVKRVAQRLGCLDDVEVKLDRLLVYDRGTSYAKHEDRRVDPKVFAKLIIQPPSIYTGGEIVYHEVGGGNCLNSQKTIEFGKSSGKQPYAVHFAARSIDTQHELAVITSGYRLELVYNLSWTTGFGRIVRRSFIQENLSHSLTSLASSPYQLGVLFKSQQTMSEFKSQGLDAFKGRERAYLDLLLTVNSQLPEDKQHAFFLCHASRTERNKLLLTDWHDINGKLSFASSSFEVDKFTQLFDLALLKPVELNDQTVWPAQSRAHHHHHPTIDNRRCMLVMWPKRFEFDTLLNMNSSLAIRTLHHALLRQKQPADADRRAQFERVVKSVRQRADAGANEADNASSVPCGPSRTLVAVLLEICVKFDDLQLFDEFWTWFKPKMDMRFISASLAYLVARFGVDALRERLQTLVIPCVKFIIPNCLFILHLLKYNQNQIAYRYFTSCVLFLLEDKSNMKTLVINVTKSIPNEDEIETTSITGCSKSNKKATAWKLITKASDHPLIILLKCLNAFPKLSTTTVNSLENAMQERLVQDDDNLSMESVVDSFEKNSDADCDKQMDELKTCPHVIGMLTVRKHWLEKQVRSILDVSWSMPPIKMAEYPVIGEFLKSDKKEMNYTFKRRDSVAKFLRLVNVIYKNSPVSVDVVHKSPTSVVIVKKNLDIERRLRLFDKYVKELKKLDTFLNTQISV